MGRKIRVPFGYLVLVLVMGFSVTSCSTYNKYRSAWFGEDGRFVKLLGKSQVADNNQDGAEDKKLGDEPDAEQPKNNNRGVSEDITITVNTGKDSEREKPLLEHYEELLAKLLEDEKEINQLRDKQDGHDKIVEELEAEVADLKAKLKEEEGESLDLEEKNSELEISVKLAKESNALEECEKRYADETEKLKVQLVKSQIAEVKAKQELVRTKTQYVMDKKKWEQ